MNTTRAHLRVACMLWLLCGRLLPPNGRIEFPDDLR